uniref:Oleosin 1 n=1 Tax=Tanacetum cinerariifolium TaxID=118510 RepID=A0A6L2NWW2_TANCI|nr:oleosin 1 [Tanacetum cinerariifolium]
MSELVSDQGALQHHQQQHTNKPRYQHVVKAVTAAAASSSLIVLSGLTFTGTLLELVVVTPVLVLFSPVLVPAVLALFLLAIGFLTSVLFSIGGTIVLAWLYKYVKYRNITHDSSGDVTKNIDSKGLAIMDKGEDTTGRVDQSALMTSKALKEHARTKGHGDQHEVLKTVAKFLVSQMLGGVTTSVLMWLYKYVTGEHPRGADTLDSTMRNLGSKAREIRDKSEHMTQDLSSKVIIKATKIIIGSSLILLSGLTFVGTVFGLILITPLFVIFSPVLVSAVIAVFVLATGFFISEVVGFADVAVLAWLYMYVTYKHPIGANSLDRMMHKLGLMGQEMTEKSVHAIGGDGYTNGVEWGHQESSFG